VARPEWIEVGRISRPHGVQGEVRITPSSDNPDRFAPGTVLHARPARSGLAASRLRERRLLTVVAIRGEQDFPIVAFQEVTGREVAESLRGYVLEVPSSELPELGADEYYPFDLVGLEVRNPSGTMLGRVAEVLESPAHPLLAVETAGGGQELVPFVAAVVLEVDLGGRFLVIAEGFLD
jgi:16S rRNA processing protein RimM